MGNDSVRGMCIYISVCVCVRVGGCVFVCWECNEVTCTSPCVPEHTYTSLSVSNPVFFFESPQEATDVLVFNSEMHWTDFQLLPVNFRGANSGLTGTVMNELALESFGLFTVCFCGRFRCSNLVRRWTKFVYFLTLCVLYLSLRPIQHQLKVWIFCLSRKQDLASTRHGTLLTTLRRKQSFIEVKLAIKIDLSFTAREE